MKEDSLKASHGWNFKDCFHFAGICRIKKTSMRESKGPSRTRFDSGSCSFRLNSLIQIIWLARQLQLDDHNAPGNKLSTHFQGISCYILVVFCWSRVSRFEILVKKTVYSITERKLLLYRDVVGNCLPFDRTNLLIS